MREYLQWATENCFKRILVTVKVIPKLGRENYVAEIE